MRNGARAERIPARPSDGSFNQLDSNRRFAALAGSECSSARGVQAGACALDGGEGAGEEWEHEMGSDQMTLSP